MKPLPFDYYRCAPIVVDSWCQQCARWNNHPGQVYGTRTGVMQCESSADEGCGYIHETRDEMKDKK